MWIGISSTNIQYPMANVNTYFIYQYPMANVNRYFIYQYPISNGQCINRYFIYLTNNGRWVAAAALLLEVNPFIPSFRSSNANAGCVGVTKIPFTWAGGRFWGERGSRWGGRKVRGGDQGGDRHGAEGPPHPPHHPLGAHQHLLLTLVHDHHRLLVCPLQPREEWAGLWELLRPPASGCCPPHWSSHWRQVHKSKTLGNQKVSAAGLGALCTLFTRCFLAASTLSSPSPTISPAEPTTTLNRQYQSRLILSRDTRLAISGMSTISRIGVEPVEQLGSWSASPSPSSPSMPSSVWWLGWWCCSWCFW